MQYAPVSSPDFVIVSGPPGSGKSTLAAPLAKLLGLPLIEKDTIKEALMDTLGVEKIADSRQIGRAAIATMFALARANGQGVLDSNWMTSLAARELQDLGGVIVEVFCEVDSSVSRQRYLDRATERHRGHFDRERADDNSAWLGGAQCPIDGGWPVVRVDTSTPVDIERLVLAITDVAHRA